MKTTFKVSLKANERIYLNGAVIKVDRKTSLEFLNNVDFLLETHILQQEAADTPLKQLYFIIQIMLMTPNDTETAFHIYRQQIPALLNGFSERNIVSELKNVDRLVHEKSYYEAMRSLRDLFKFEEYVLAENPLVPATNSISSITKIQDVEATSRNHAEALV